MSTPVKNPEHVLFEQTLTATGNWRWPDQFDQDDKGNYINCATAMAWSVWTEARQVAEPDWTHSKLQSTLSDKARKSIELRLIQSAVDATTVEELEEVFDNDYGTKLLDQVKVLKRATLTDPGYVAAKLNHKPSGAEVYVHGVRIPYFELGVSGDKRREEVCQAINKAAARQTQADRIRFLNLSLDIRRVLNWEKPLNDFDEVKELQEFVNAQARLDKNCKWVAAYRSKALDRLFYFSRIVDSKKDADTICTQWQTQYPNDTFEYLSLPVYVGHFHEDPTQEG